MEPTENTTPLVEVASEDSIVPALLQSAHPVDFAESADAAEDAEAPRS